MPKGVEHVIAAWLSVTHFDRCFILLLIFDTWVRGRLTLPQRVSFVDAKGVEHSVFCELSVICCWVFHSLMPKGVEHGNGLIDCGRGCCVSLLMPKGVVLTIF